MDPPLPPLPSTSVIVVPTYVQKVYKSPSRRGPHASPKRPRRLCDLRPKSLNAALQWKKITKQKQKNATANGGSKGSRGNIFGHKKKRNTTCEEEERSQQELLDLEEARVTFSGIGGGGRGERGSVRTLFAIIDSLLLLRLLPFRLSLLRLLVVLTVASEQSVQVLLQGVGLKALGRVVQALQVHVFPQGVAHHSPLLRSPLTHLASARGTTKRPQLLYRFHFKQLPFGVT